VTIANIKFCVDDLNLGFTNNEIERFGRNIEVDNSKLVDYSKFLSNVLKSEKKLN